MAEMTWAGVMPAITTPFDDSGEVDLAAVPARIDRMIDAGVTGIVPCGSLGEGQTLRAEEKRDLIATVVASSDDRVPVIPAIGAASTAEAVELAGMAAELGCTGLMVLPPYVHSGDTREVFAHFATVFAGSALECMLYNNPHAYAADLGADEIAALAADHGNLSAVKESSGDARRVSALRERLGDRIAVFAGLDDMIVEAIGVGAVGWIAGMVNAFPRESVELFERAKSRDPRVEQLYHWFLPILRLDVVPDFVQRIKFAEELMEVGTARVRAPRLSLEPEEADQVRAIIRHALETRPD